MHGGREGLGASLVSSLSACCNLKILQLDYDCEDTLAIVLRGLPRTTQRLEELGLTSHQYCSARIETELLTAVRNLPCLKKIAVASRGIQSVTRNEINHICMLRSLVGRHETLMNLPLGLYPCAIETLARRREWVSIVHHFVCEKHDELVGARQLGI